MPGADSLARVVLDASVAVRWTVDEPGNDEVTRMMEEATDWLAPRLMMTEAASALRRKIKEGVLETAEGVEALDILLDAADDGTIELVEDERLIHKAFHLALTLEHKVPDCLYLALAERENAALVTADDRLHKIARSRGVESRFITSA